MSLWWLPQVYDIWVLTFQGLRFQSTKLVDRLTSHDVADVVLMTSWPRPNVNAYGSDLGNLDGKKIQFYVFRSCLGTVQATAFSSPFHWIPCQKLHWIDPQYTWKLLVLASFDALENPRSLFFPFSLRRWGWIMGTCATKFTFLDPKD